ncbi:MAG: hypothetical protein AAFX99_34685 [Myxococcota bacterium]
MRSQRFLQPALVAGAAAAAFSGGCVSSGTYAPELDEAVSPPNDYGERVGISWSAPLGPGVETRVGVYIIGSTHL